jgi:acetyltransferase
MLLLSPSSIAVIGASADEKKVGHMILKNIITQGFKGEVFPVNPKTEKILGKKSYPSVTALPSVPDIVVIVTPGSTVPGLLEECGTKGVKDVIVISAGFGETGTDEGHKLEQEVIATAKKHGIRLVGPNCLGVIRTSAGMNASFAENLDRKGSIALLSQSGALAVALLDAATDLRMGFSLVVSMGNKSVMNECDFLELCKDDPETSVIGMYVESIVDGKRFLKIASEVCKTKSVVLIKSGVSERGKQAVSSHTGALAGSDAAIDAACAQTGIRRAKNTEEFMDILRAIATQPPLLSPKIAVITNAGGPGILATDASEAKKLILADLEPSTKEKLKTKLPPAASVKNPVDVLGDAVADRYAAALAACADDPNIDGIAVLLTPQVMTPEEDIANAIVAEHKSHGMIPVVTSFMGKKNVGGAAAILQENGIPNFETPERAIAALASLLPKMSPRVETRRAGFVTRGGNEGGSSIRSASAELLGMTQGLLAEDKTAELFKLYNLPLPSSDVAKTADEAVAIAMKIGYPIVAKISSPQILHKTDIGCVRVGIKNDADLKKAFEEIMANAKKGAPKATLQGVLIQQLLPAGSEFIVGALKDATFGHLVMAGLGGIYTELFRDVAFRISPITEEEAYRQLQELRSWKMLLGMRGKEQSDIVALAKLIENISHLVSDNPRIQELDLNPVIVRADGVVIADAKVVIE